MPSTWATIGRSRGLTTFHTRWLPATNPMNASATVEIVGNASFAPSSAFDTTTLAIAPTAR